MQPDVLNLHHLRLDTASNTRRYTTHTQTQSTCRVLNLLHHHLLGLTHREQSHALDGFVRRRRVPPFIRRLGINHPVDYAHLCFYAFLCAFHVIRLHFRHSFLELKFHLMTWREQHNSPPAPYLPPLKLLPLILLHVLSARHLYSLHVRHGARVAAVKEGDELHAVL